MNAKINLDIPTPPSYIIAIKNGFNAVTNHLGVILFPILLDLLFLFGPQIRIANLLAPFYNLLINQFAQLPQDQQFSIGDQALIINSIKEGISSINLMTILSTFPLGIPSVINPGILTNPVGLPYEINMSSFRTAFGLILVLFMVGLGLGVIYFNILSKLGAENQQPTTFKNIYWQYLQIFTLCICMLVIACFIFFPAFIIIMLLTMVNSIIGQVLFFVFMFLILWLGFPLIFSLHGIFAYNQNIFSSALTSYRLVRSGLPNSGLFMSIVILVYLLFDRLWRIAPVDSWIILASIIGHAFLFSGLFVSTFIYYRNSIDWMREMIKRNPRPITQIKI